VEMDGLSAAASIIAVLQVTASLAKFCRTYIKNYKDAPKEFISIIIEVGSVGAVLQATEAVSQQACGNSALLQQLEGDLGPLEMCRVALTKLEELMLPVGHENMNDDEKMQAFRQNRLKWSLKMKKAQELLNELQKLKNSMSFVITTEIL
jgi:hypothetical protein